MQSYKICILLSHGIFGVFISLTHWGLVTPYGQRDLGNIGSDNNHYTASINCCKKTFYCNDHTITEFGIIGSKNSSTAYVILYELIDTWFLDSKRRVGVWSLSWRWHIHSIPWTTGQGTGAKTCWMDDVFLLMTFVPVKKLCVKIYIYMHFLYEFCYRTYIYMQQQCHSVLVKCAVPGLNPTFCFFGLPIVSCSLMIIV